MRKHILLLATLFVLGVTTSAQAQDWKSILGDIAKNVVGDVATTQASILGTWNYSGPAIKMAGDNTLANLGGEVATATVESKLIPIYTKVGLDKCVFTFNEDGTYKTEMGKIKTSGTYTFDVESKTIVFKTKLGASVSATVSTAGTSMTLMFKADKLMGALKTIIGFAGNMSKSVSTINSLIKNYDGMSLGFELKKQQ